MATRTEGNLAVEPEWRREVSIKLQDYRARRRGVAHADLQTTLPFDSHSPYPIDVASTRPEIASPENTKRTAGPRRSLPGRFELAIPALEDATAADITCWPVPVALEAGRSQETLHCVASLPDRRRAALVDAGLLLFSYGGMLALFTVLGGHIGWNRPDMVVAGATFALFYAQYFALFTVFGGATPGMMLKCLRVVNFDGSIPTSRQMARRSLGYLISAGACFLGFVWAIWDEDQLCWHDRLSRTYLAPNDEITPY